MHTACFCEVPRVTVIDQRRFLTMGIIIGIDIGGSTTKIVGFENNNLFSARLGNLFMTMQYS